MQGLIDCGKYKVTEVLSSHSGFEAALCSDVTVNDGTVYIVNEYSSMVYIRELLQLFCAMEKRKNKIVIYSLRRNTKKRCSS